MKKIAALAVLASVSALAHAQSNVTLFGVVDAAVRYTKNGDQNTTALVSGGGQTNRIGFRGTEDLGGGLKAGFWLEAGLNPDTGTSPDAARFWNRRSTVSLSSNSIGEIRLGRDFVPTYTGYSDYEVFGTTGIADGSKFVSKLGTNVDNTVRADNMVAYFLPGGLGGLYGQVSVAAGENTPGKKYTGGRIGYSAGALDVSASYGVTQVSPLAGTTDDEYQFGTIAAAYTISSIKLTGYVTQAKYATAKQTIGYISASWTMGAGTLRASYIDVNSSGRTPAGVSIARDDANQIAVGYMYDLSKRTSVYTTVARIDNDNAAAYAVGTPPALPSPNNGRDSTGVEFGIRHRF